VASLHVRLHAQPWELVVNSEGMPPRRVDRLLASVPGVAAVGRRYGTVAMAGGVELETRVIDGCRWGRGCS
jgi:hypothetical protein